MNLLDTTPATTTPAQLVSAGLGVANGPKSGAVADTLYTTSELASWIRVSPSTIEKDRSIGRGSYPPFVRIGGRLICYRHGDIMNWLHGHRFNHDSSRAASVQ